MPESRENAKKIVETLVIVAMQEQGNDSLLNYID